MTCDHGDHIMCNECIKPAGDVPDCYLRKDRMTPKLKSIKALLLGYLFFTVTINLKVKSFWLYHHARDFRLSNQDADYVCFEGFNVWKYFSDLITRKNKVGKIRGTRGFFYKFRTIKPP